MSKLPGETIQKIRREVLGGESKHAVAKKMKICPETVYRHTKDLPGKYVRQPYICGKRLELLKEILEKGFVYTGKNRNDLRRLQKHFSVIKRSQFKNRSIYYLKDKNKLALQEMMKQDTSRIISFQELSKMSKVFNTDLEIKQKRAFLGKNPRPKRYKIKKLQRNYKFSSKEKQSKIDDFLGVFLHSEVLGGGSVSLYVVTKTLERLSCYISSFFKKVYNFVANTRFLVEKEMDKEEKETKHMEFVPNLSKTSKWILLMLFAGGNTRKYNESVSGRIRLIKEIFLFINQAKIKENIYEFRPYKYGPFANEFLFDLDVLKNHGFITEREGFGGQNIELTPKGIKYAKKHYDELNDDLKRRLIGVKVRFNKMPLNDLLTYVYSNYPKYAEKSEYTFDNSKEVY